MTICHLCRQETLVCVGPVEEWGIDPPPIDADQYSLWRCTFVVAGEPCGNEIKRKVDGTPTTDKRYTTPLVNMS